MPKANCALVSGAESMGCDLAVLKMSLTPSRILRLLAFTLVTTISFTATAQTTDGVLYVAGDKMGIHTDTPTESLHIRGSDGTSKILVEEVSGTSVGRNLFKIANNGAVRFDLEDFSAASRTWRFANGGSNFSILDLADPFVVEFQLSNSGDLTITGELVTGGTTCGGGCDLVFSPDTEIESIEDHATEMWAKGHLPAVGPTTEGAPFNLTR